MTLTDYDRLAEYVPNLTESKTKPSDDGRIRLWQEGAQKIVGFDFRASVEMFMEEQFGGYSRSTVRPNAHFAGGEAGMAHRGGLMCVITSRGRAP